MSKRLEQEAAKTNINNELVEELLSQANPSELFVQRWVVSATKEAVSREDT